MLKPSLHPILRMLTLSPVNPSAKQFLSIIFGIALGCFAFSVAAISQKNFSPENAGLGINTYGVSDTWEDQIINESIFSRIQPSWNNFKRKEDKVILWLGASQTYSINNPKEGDHLAVWHLNQLLKTQNSHLDALLLARPNANLHDLLAFYLTAREKGYLPQVLIVGVVFDDLRDPAGQKQVMDELPQIPLSLQRAELKGVQQLVEVKNQYLSEQGKISAGTFQNIEIKKSPQESLEEFLISGIEKIFPGYQYRNNLAAKIEFSLAGLGSKLRQRILHRRAPRIPEDKIAWSYAALESLILLAKKDGVQLLIYKPPHRPNEPVFYHNREDYDAFFNRLRARCEKEGVYYADYEKIVHEKYWGLADGGLPDVFHFQGQGHKILADALFETLISKGVLKNAL